MEFDAKAVLGAALAVVATSVVVVGTVKAGDSVVVGVPIRADDGTYSYVELAADVLEDGGFVLPEKAGMVVGDVVVKKCDVGDSVFCLGKGERPAPLPCRIPVDETCLRTYLGTDAGRWAGYNVMPAAEASGNCKPVQCAILAGDVAP